MINAIYVISRTGLPIVSVFKGDRRGDDENALFSGVLSAIQTALIEINIGFAKFLDTNKYEIFLELNEDFAVAIIKEAISKADKQIIHDFTAKLLQELDDKFPELDESNSIAERKLKEIRSYLDKSIVRLEKELSKRRTTRDISDSFW